MSGAGALGPLMGEQAAGAAEAAQDRVIDQQHAVCGAQRTQRLQLALVQRARAALALHRLDDHRRRRRAEQGLQRLVVAKRRLQIARQPRAETIQIGRVARGVDRRVGAAVKRAVEADHVDPLGLAVGRVILPRGLQCAFHRLRPGVGEEHHVGEGRLAQGRGQRLLLRNAVDVGDVPELFSLRLQRRDQLGMGVAQRVDRDAGDAVQIGLAVGGEQARALASLERQRGAAIDAQDVVVGARGRCARHVAASQKRECPRAGWPGTGRLRLFAIQTRPVNHARVTRVSNPAA